MKYSDKELREIASAIVVRLFTNGTAEVADRLVLWRDARKNDVLPVPTNLGGWCREAVVDQVRDVLRAKLSPPSQRAKAKGKGHTK